MREIQEIYADHTAHETQILNVGHLANEIHQEHADSFGKRPRPERGFLICAIIDNVIQSPHIQVGGKNG
jgi:hypothetical protein